MSSRLEQLIARADEEIQSFLAQAKKPLIAYSGGKDGNVAAHLMYRHGVFQCVCEMSFYFQQQKDDIRAFAEEQGFQVDLVEYRDWKWLANHPEFLFTDDAKQRSRAYAQRQQRTAKKYAKDHGHDAIVFGRRVQENSVKASKYMKDGLLYFHPIREWKESDVWDYFEYVGMRKPWVYTIQFGRWRGNAPFYAVRPSDIGSKEKAWEYVMSVDPSITPERLANAR